jgi:hypothetical protein
VEESKLLWMLFSFQFDEDLIFKEASSSVNNLVLKSSDLNEVNLSSGLRKIMSSNFETNGYSWDFMT